MTSFEIQLTNLERRLMSFYRRAGTSGVVGLVTLVALCGSLGIVMGVMRPLSGPIGEEAYWYFLGGSLFVPLTVAPVTTYFFARLLVLLDKAFLAVESLSTTDPLTGAANRRGFFTLAEYSLRSVRSQQTCMVGMIDLNDFKNLNDTYGHKAGDQALIYIANLLIDLIGERGSVGRIGGDEFAVWFVADHDHDHDPQQSTAALIEQACARFEFTSEEGEDISLEASVGIVELTKKENFDSALARADDVQYSRKKTHRGKRVSIVRRRPR